MIWVGTGSKQVLIHSGEEKPAFTLWLEVKSFSVQAIYRGKTALSHYKELVDASFLLVEPEQTSQ